MKRGRAPAAVGQASVDFVGDDPEIACARQIENRYQFRFGRDVARGIGRRIEQDSARRRPDRRRQALRIEPPGLAAIERHVAGARAVGGKGAGEIGPSGREDERLLARPDGQAHGDIERVHAADRHEKTLGRKVAAAGRGAIDAGHIAGDRFAQFGNAGLVSVESFAAIERGLGRRDDELRRRQVAFPDPERNQTLAVAPVIEHLDDAAQLDGARGGLNFLEPIARRRRFRGDDRVHRRVMNERRRGRKRASAVDPKIAMPRPQARLGPLRNQRLTSKSRICVSRTTSSLGGAGAAGAAGAGLFSMLIPLTTRKRTNAMMRKLTATVMKLP